MGDWPITASIFTPLAYFPFSRDEICFGAFSSKEESLVARLSPPVWIRRKSLLARSGMPGIRRLTL